MSYEANPQLSEVDNFSRQAAQESPVQRAQEITSGNSQARGLLSTPDKYTDQLSYGDSAQRDAIRSKYSRGYYQNEQHLNIDALKNAQEDHLKKLEVATNMAGQEAEQNRQKLILQWKKAQAEKAARGQVIGTVLGIVGGTAGAVAGGGAPGAMAGYSLGQGVGQAAGSM